MTQAESKLSREIMMELRVQGWFCFKVHGNEYTMSGLPDIIVCAEGKFVGLETKMPARRRNVKPRQERVHGQIRAARGTVEVVCSPTEAVVAVRRALS